MRGSHIPSQLLPPANYPGRYSQIELALPTIKAESPRQADLSLSLCAAIPTPALTAVADLTGHHCFSLSPTGPRAIPQSPSSGFFCKQPHS